MTCCCYSIYQDMLHGLHLIWFLILCLKTAALAQKNSEATRALAVQEDILEKELGEIQKVLLAMQVSSMRTANPT